MYIYTDVETDGPIPGEYSMLSIGSVAFSPDGKVLGKFYRKLKRLKGAKQHPETMKFWKEHPKDYKEATKNSEAPSKVMKDYVNWLEKMEKKNNAKSIFVSWPLAFDYQFVFWYMVKFVKKFQTGKVHPFDIPFSFNMTMDAGTMEIAQMSKEITKISEKDMAKGWAKDVKELSENKGHKAIDDAMDEGKIFIKMLKENRGKNEKSKNKTKKHQ